MADTDKKTLTVKLVRSVAGTRESHRATVRGLGLRKIGQTAEVVDTPQTRGMIRSANHLIKLQEG